MLSGPKRYQLLCYTTKLFMRLSAWGVYPGHGLNALGIPSAWILFTHFPGSLSCKRGGSGCLTQLLVG